MQNRVPINRYKMKKQEDNHHKMTSLEKLIYILELFKDIPEELTLSQMAERTGLNKSTINRIASLLVRKGYLNQMEKGGSYSLGTVFLDYSGTLKKRINIRDVVIPYLTSLKQKVGESCSLMVWDGREATLTDTVHSDSVLRAVPDEGSKIALHATSAGKLFLANLPESEITVYLDNGIKQYTTDTIVDPATLGKQLRLIKEKGYSIDLNERTMGISSVAAAILDNEGKIAGAICIIGPSVRLTRAKLTDIAPEVIKCATEISRQLGWK
jgi:DNA-binding IclR family transcriptional regulator